MEVDNEQTYKQRRLVRGETVRDTHAGWLKYVLQETPSGIAEVEHIISASKTIFQPLATRYIKISATLVRMRQKKLTYTTINSDSS